MGSHPQHRRRDSDTYFSNSYRFSLRNSPRASALNLGSTSSIPTAGSNQLHQTHMSNYVVAVFSMKARWLRANPEAARMRIRVLAASKFERIRTATNLSEQLPRRFKRWVEEDGTTQHQTELDAYDAAARLQTQMRDCGRATDLNLGKNINRVYAFEMNPSVLEDRKFSKMNLDAKLRSPACCVYVGMTACAIHERYDQHRSTTHTSRTKWGRDFFLSPFQRADRSDLVRQFKEAGNPIEEMNKHEALTRELQLRCWLQTNGIAAYSA